VIPGLDMLPARGDQPNGAYSLESVI
jgi:hypothetical protein